MFSFLFCLVESIYSIISGAGKIMLITHAHSVDRIQCLGSYVTENMLSSKEVKTRIIDERKCLTAKENRFVGYWTKIKKRLAKVYVGSVAMYGAETWTVREEDERRVTAPEVWVTRKMVGMNGVDTKFEKWGCVKENRSKKSDFRNYPKKKGPGLDITLEKAVWWRGNRNGRIDRQKESEGERISCSR